MAMIQLKEKYYTAS